MIPAQSWPQNFGATWSASPNVQWQDTTSNATYLSAANLLS